MKLRKKANNNMIEHENAIVQINYMVTGNCPRLSRGHFSWLSQILNVIICFR